MGGSFDAGLAFGIYVEDGEEARWAVDGLDALEVYSEGIENIPRCDFADSDDTFITLLPRYFAMRSCQLDVDFDELDAIMKDERKTAQWRTCLERLGLPYRAPRVYPVMHISP